MKFHFKASVQSLCATALLCSGAFAQIQNPLASVPGAALGQAIKASRDSAIGQGKPIPDEVRNQLKDFFPDTVFELVKYKIGDGGVLNVARNTLFNKRVGAMTMIDLIVFRSELDAKQNAVLWAHELWHVQQYAEWGVNSFAVQYVRDADEVERPAYSYQAQVDRALNNKLAAGCSTARVVVQELYRAILQREGEEAGVRGHALSLNASKLTVRQLASAFATSEEHTNGFARGRASEDQVRTLYRHLLAREGEPQGVAHNTNALNSSNYANVVNGFIQSPEYTARFGDWTVPSSRQVKFCS